MKLLKRLNRLMNTHSKYKRLPPHVVKLGPSINSDCSEWVEVNTGKKITTVWFSDGYNGFLPPGDAEVEYVKKLLKLDPEVLNRSIVDYVMINNLDTIEMHCITLFREDYSK